MKIKELMTRDVEYLAPADTIEAAARMMGDYDVGSVPVIADGRVVGIVTDRDVVVRGVAAGFDVRDGRVGDIMTSEVIHCHEEDAIEDAARLMEQYRIRRIVIIDDAGRLSGIVALADLAERTGAAEKVLREVSRPVVGPIAVVVTAADDEINDAATDGDVSFLVKDELVAAETYQQALEKLDGAGAGDDLRRIETEHIEAARLLQKRMRDMGRRPPDKADIRGARVIVAQGADRFVGKKAVIKALKEGEERGIHDYEDALKDSSVPPEIKELIGATLLPRSRAHVPVLDAYLRAGV